MAFVALALWAGAGWVAAASPQESGGDPIIQEIVIEGAGDLEAEIRRSLALQVGGPFSSRLLERDEEILKKKLRVLILETRRTDLPDGKVRLHFSVAPIPSYSRVVFRGNDVFTREELLLQLGLGGALALEDAALSRYGRAIVEIYRQEGHAFAEVDWEIGEAGDEVAFQIQEGPQVKIQRVEFVGNASLPGRRLIGAALTDAMESKPGKLFFPGAVYSEESVARDLIALEHFYQDFGFLDAAVTLEKVEFEGGGEDAILRFRVEEGEPYVVSKVEILPYREGGRLLRPMEELLGILTLEPGQPFEMARIRANEVALRKHYGRLGHPTAPPMNRSEGFFRVNPEGRPRLRYPGGGQVEVAFMVEEGRRMRIRKVLVEGNTLTKDRVIRRDILLEPGDLADTALAVRSQRRLLGRGWFIDAQDNSPYVNFQFRDTPREDEVDLAFMVREGGRGTRTFNFGGGVNGEYGAFLMMNLKFENFDISDLPSSFGSGLGEIFRREAFVGGGQTLKVQATPGARWSRFSFNFLEPDLFGDHIDRTAFSLSASRGYRFLKSHEEDRRSYRPSLSRNFGRWMSIYLAPDVGRMTLVNPGASPPDFVEDAEGAHDVNSLTFGARWNTIDDAFSDRKGLRANFSLAQFGKWMGGEYDFLRPTLDFGGYFPLWEDSQGRAWSLVFEGTARRSLAQGDLASIPYLERFWLGGHSGHGQLRGFDYRGASDVQSGFPLGGDSSWRSSLELRFPLSSTRRREVVEEYEWVRGAFFVDSGALGFGNDFESTRVSAGFGVRIRFPAMPHIPIALDFGWPIKSEDGDDARHFSFDIGLF